MILTRISKNGCGGVRSSMTPARLIPAGSTAKPEPGGATRGRRSQRMPRHLLTFPDAQAPYAASSLPPAEPAPVLDVAERDIDRQGGLGTEQ